MQENEQSLKSKTINSLIWKFAERCGAQIVSFIVSIVLARVLAPHDYGLIAIVTIFITISQVFVDSGLGNALIQKKEAKSVDFSSVFYFNIIACLFFYLLLFFSAPLLAQFYKNESLVSIFRVLGLTIIISAVKNVQQAYVSRNMIFKRFFFATLGGTILAAIVGIAMACYGFGVWALVAQQLVNVTVDTLILWITVRWRPTKEFSLSHLKELFSYGWKLLVSSLINNIYGNIRQLIIGILYSSADLAYYNRGSSFPSMIVTNINSSIDSVLLPAMSGQQDNVKNVKNMTRRSIKISSYIMWPLMIGLAVIARPLISLLLTDKWLPAVPYLQIYCVVLAFEPIHTANLNAIKAMGRSDIFLKLERIKKSIGLVILIIAMQFGVLAIAQSLLVYSIIAQILNSSPNKKLLGYSYIEQLKDIFPSVLLACLMGCVIYPLKYLGINQFVIMILQIIIGAIVYVLSSYLSKIDSFSYIVEIIKKFKK